LASDWKEVIGTVHHNEIQPSHSHSNSFRNREYRRKIAEVKGAIKLITDGRASVNLNIVRGSDDQKQKSKLQVRK